jgi:hypothetical protein
MALDSAIEGDLLNTTPRSSIVCATKPLATRPNTDVVCLFYS